jgi:hypothetical protein
VVVVTVLVVVEGLASSATVRCKQNSRRTEVAGMPAIEGGRVAGTWKSKRVEVGDRAKIPEESWNLDGVLPAVVLVVLVTMVVLMVVLMVLASEA